MEAREIVLTRAAERDLMELRSYSFEQFGRAIADRYIDELEQAFTLLRDYPSAGALRQEFGEEIRVLSRRSHRIFYQIKDMAIVIVRVLHHARRITSDDMA